LPPTTADGAEGAGAELGKSEFSFGFSDDDWLAPILLN
jgi:hypothetical protein